ncbi:MAG TPA: hypothetical protein PK823_19330, partial [Novosphingobium sp.]|nr:hypothetical protein [Novosphingobium sp.]
PFEQGMAGAEFGKDVVFEHRVCLHMSVCGPQMALGSEGGNPFPLGLLRGIAALPEWSWYKGEKYALRGLRLETTARIGRDDRGT